MDSDPFLIVLADDHVLLRRGIKKLIEEDTSLKVIGEVSDGLELLELLKKVKPNLIICDIAMPRLQGLEACLCVKEVYPDIKVLMLSMHKNQEYLKRAMTVRFDGYVLKQEADTALRSAIQAIRCGQTYFSPHFSE